MTQSSTSPPLRRSSKDAALATNGPFLRLLGAYKRRFESHLHRRLAKAERRFPRVGPAVHETVHALVELCERGGKRVRPGLVLAGARCITDRPSDAVLMDAAIALELLHGYFLVHDDWMDGDLVRRGGPSVHALLRTRLKQDSVGDAAAILAGDWGVAVATDWMANLPVDGGALKRALACFAEMQLAAVVGQIRDLVATDEDAELTYRLKTASYTVNGPLLLGAILAGATPAQSKAITQFAVPVGVAFQLRDDIIGVFAPPERTGKPFASDIRAGKRTALVIECLKRVDSRDSRFMRRVLGNPEASERDLVRFVRLLEDSGALGHIEGRIRTLYRRGLAQLAKSKLRAGGKVLLESAADALIRRDT